MADSVEKVRTIRFPFNPITCQYSTRHKFSELGWPISDATQEEFFKAIYEGTHQFKTFKHYKKLSQWALMSFLFVLFVGILVLILGFMPINGDTISTPTLAAGGTLILVAIIGYLIWYCSMSSFYKQPLYKDYSAIIHSTVYQFFNSYLTNGLQWTSGTHGFRCLEFTTKMLVSNIEAGGNTNRAENNRI